MNRSCAGRTLSRYCSITNSGCATPLGDVPTKSSDQPDVGGGVDEDLEVEPFAQRPIPEHEDAVDHDDPRRFDHADLVAAVVLGVVVHRNGHGGTVGECREVVVQQRPVEGVGMVVVDGPALLDRRVAQVQVVRVEFDQGQVVGAGHRHQTLRDRGLSRAAPARDTDHERAPRHAPHDTRTGASRPAVAAATA